MVDSINSTIKIPTEYLEPQAKGERVEVGQEQSLVLKAHQEANSAIVKFVGSENETISINLKKRDISVFVGGIATGVALAALSNFKAEHLLLAPFLAPGFFVYLAYKSMLAKSQNIHS
jgi:hypothetical protein